MHITIVAAIARGGVIGKNGGLPWDHLVDDMLHFRAVTMGKICIVGRKTLDSIGGSLPGRKLICVSSQMDRLSQGVIWAANPLWALKYARYSLEEQGDDEVMVIGGASIYEQLLPYATRLYLTNVHEDHGGDAFWQPDLSAWTTTDVLYFERCTITTHERIPVQSERILTIPLESVS